MRSESKDSSVSDVSSNKSCGERILFAVSTINTPSNVNT